MRPKGFTLIELLVVIAIIAVIATATILVINPAELIKQGRDSTRLSDLNNINRSLGFLQVDQPDTSFGSSSVVYVSIPDTSSTCVNLGLSSLPAGWAYSCSTDANHRKVDGTGWIPADFTSFSAGSPLSVLPIDPINTTSTGNYYTYVTGGSWELTAYMESSKHLERAKNDGGVDVVTYEIGSNLTLSPFVRGLIGYWKFDEGSGTSASDSSGAGNTANFVIGTPSWLSGTDCSLGGCIYFAGDSDMKVNANALFNLYPGARTISAWINRTGGGIGLAIEQLYGGGVVGNFMIAPNYKVASYRDGPVEVSVAVGGATVDIWYHLVVIQNKETGGRGYLKSYINGVLAGSVENISFSSGGGGDLWFGARGSQGDSFFVGRLDDIRIYNRALSAAEISAIYNASQ